MAVAFSEKERESIINALRKAAAEHAARDGMRKTTVDELASEAGISKGAFYKFYDSKEHLFLDMLSKWHQSIFDAAQAVLDGRSDLNGCEQAALLLKTACRLIRKQGLDNFCADELPILLRKLPDQLVEERYQTDDEFILHLIDQAGMRLLVSRDEACTMVRIIFLSLTHQTQVGAHFEAALDGIIDCVCSRLVLP